MEKIKRPIILEEDKLNIGNNIYDFEFLTYLGGGNDHHYVKAKSKLNDEIYVIKIIENIKIETYKNIEESLNIIKILDHPNLLKYYSSFIEKENYYIIMEYAEGGNLKNYIKIHKILDKKIDENKINKIFYQSMSALKFLQKEDCLHRNLSTSNIFLTKNGDIKIGGFEYLCKQNKNTNENENLLKPKGQIYLKKQSNFVEDIESLKSIIFNIRYLMPQYKIIILKNNNLRIFTKKENIKKKKNEKAKKNENGKDLDLIIKSNYSKSYGENLNSSIKCAYFTLIYLFQNQKINNREVNRRKINVNKELKSNKPITQSFKIKNLSILREILKRNNPKFEEYGEISPFELIKFLIKQLHIENNKIQNFYSKIYSSDYESYNKLYNNNFNSFISNKEKGLFGVFQIFEICENCSKKNSYYESFYYITLDLDSTEKGVNIYDFFQNNSFITETYKFCQKCQNVTKHCEIKSIKEFPCRLVILFKNNLKKKLITSQTFNIFDTEKQKKRKYFAVATINYYDFENKYEYSYYIHNDENEEQKWEHENKRRIHKHGINNENIIAMFFLFFDYCD